METMDKPRTARERRCWRWAYAAALRAGDTDEQARAYADACLRAYRREVE